MRVPVVVAIEHAHLDSYIHDGMACKSHCHCKLPCSAHECNSILRMEALHFGRNGCCTLGVMLAIRQSCVVHGNKRNK